MNTMHTGLRGRHDDGLQLRAWQGNTPPSCLVAHRLRTMSDQALRLRIRKIRNVTKMTSFVQVWKRVPSCMGIIGKDPRAE